MSLKKKLKGDLLEKLAELEHKQWIEWSKNLACNEALSEGRLLRWRGYWIKYASLSEDNKKHDRKWAKKVLAILYEELGLVAQQIRECIKEGKEVAMNGEDVFEVEHGFAELDKGKLVVYLDADWVLGLLVEQEGEPEK